jgi:hypothetical protein
MKRISLKSWVSIAVLFFTVTLVAADQSADETAIRALETRQQEAWNHHDAKAYASLFTEEGDCVNVVGWWWKGRGEISQMINSTLFCIAERALARGGSALSRWALRVGRREQGEK